MVGEKCCILYEIVRPNKDPSKRTSYSNIVVYNKTRDMHLGACIDVYIYTYIISTCICTYVYPLVSLHVHDCPRWCSAAEISPALGRNHWSCWTIRATKKQLRYSELVSALTDASLEVPVGSGGPQLSTQRNSNESMRYTASKVVG